MPAELRTWVDDIEILSGSAGLEKFVHVPDVATVLVFRTTAAGRSDLIAVGPRSRGTYHPGKPLPVCIRMRVRPGRSRALLGLPINELADRVIPLADLWGAAGKRLADDLAAAPHDAERALTRIGAALRERADSVRSTSAARARSVARHAEAADAGRLETAMSALSSGAPASAAAGRLGISERQLRNIFAREVGLSPKHFARIARLRRVLALAGNQRWAQVAGDTGFFDQAHMITDFRALMGVSPGAFTAGRLPPTAPCAELSGGRRLPPA
jgi:AraC-like DNA-binding protein